MKITIALVAVCLSYAVATPANPRPNYKNIELEALDTEIEDGGKYHYSYENSDGAKVSQDGVLKQVDAEHAGTSVSGSFSYKDDDGIPVSLTYTADETGYHPVGDHLPTPPPIPDIIQRALAYLATAPPQTEEPKA